MEQYTDKSSSSQNEVELNPLAINSASLEVNGNSNIDVLGGRVVPDFYDLATAGFNEGELKDLLRLRSQYNKGLVNDLTEEYKRLQFARWLYQQGKINS